MKHFDEMGLLHEKAGCEGWILHEKAGCEGWILHETADSGLEGVLGEPVRALERADRSGRGTGLRAAGGRHAHLRRHCGCFPVNSHSRVDW